MAAVPNLAQEDDRRPSRERESLVGERTRLVNRMKAALARLGIRDFRPGLRRAQDRLETLRTPAGVPVPPNTLAELRRAMARLRLVDDQTKELEAARRGRLERRRPAGARGAGARPARSQSRGALCRPHRRSR